MWISKKKWEALEGQVGHLVEESARGSRQHYEIVGKVSALTTRLNDATTDIAKLQARVAELGAQSGFREHTILYRRALPYAGGRVDFCDAVTDKAFETVYSGESAEMPLKRVVERIMEHLGLRLQFTPQSADVVKIEPPKKGRRRG